MKICYLIDGLRLGGKERQMVELVKGLINHSFLCPEEIMVISFYRGGSLDGILKEMQVQIKYAVRKFKKDIFLLFKLNKILKEFSPDIIHTWDAMTSFYTSLLKYLRNFVFIDGSLRSAPLQSAMPFKLKILNLFNFSRANIVIANSRAGLVSFKAPPAKSRVVYNGYDKSRLKKLQNRDTIKAKFGIKTNKFIGMVANFTCNKDYETFISAAKIILKTRSDVTFAAVGEGINLEGCKEMAENDDKIKFLGSQKDIESVVNIFDIGILSTNGETHGEGISNSIMEYMAAGKPVIATDIGGTRELVINGETGLLVKHRVVSELVDRIEYLLDNPQVVREMGNAGKKRIETEFSLANMVQAYIGLYNELTV